MNRRKAVDQGRRGSLRDIQRRDLTDTGRLLALLHTARLRGLVGEGERDRLWFVSCAEHALRVGSDPVRLFSWLLHRRVDHVTGADEEAARRRLRDHEAAGDRRFAPRPLPAPPPKPPLSGDARLVGALITAARRIAPGVDPYLLLCRQVPDPETWTRARFDAALEQWSTR